ncbi:MAG: DUF427 domain-containing protein [Actinobacteria bacterium]|nr:DUF427 domain-containing protein [Actinomycetota bacterium]
MLGGEIVADTATPLLVWEVPYFPTYYFPEADVRTDLFVETGETKSSPSRGEATQYEVKVNGSEGRAYSFLDPKIDDIAGHYAFVWDTIDHWFEEEEEVYTHARDPYTRIDILPSSRRVRVEIDGVTVADTRNASFLFETNLPTRYYMPKTDVAMSLFTPTDTATHCPYKGTARYWTGTVNGETYEDILWGYDTTLPESQRIAGLVAFYNEKLDIYVDDELQEKPKTKFS